METETRKCSRCKEIKAISEFIIDRSQKNGRRFECRDCQNIYRRRYRAENADKVRKKMRAHYASHRVQRILYAAKARAKERGIEFSIEASDLVIPDICPILGIP